MELSLEQRPYIELCNLLKRVGLCENGGHAKSVIAEGEVKVDGQIETRKKCKIKAGQVVEFSGEKVHVTE